MSTAIRHPIAPRDEAGLVVEGLAPTRLTVQRVAGREEMSQLPRYDIVVMATDPTPSARELLGRAATLSLRLLDETQGERVVHGVLAAVDERCNVEDGVVYELVLTPSLALANNRHRSRIFVDKTLRSIVETVLGEAGLTRLDDARSDNAFVWRIGATPRLDDDDARSFCVQYEESDLDFVRRLLEAEGIAFHFEHTEDRCLLVLSDGQHGYRERKNPFGPGVEHRDLEVQRVGARLPTHLVEPVGFRWRHPKVPATPLANVAREREESGTQWLSARGTARCLCAGDRIELWGDRHGGSYLVTAIDITVEQSAVGDATSPPFLSTVEARRIDGSAPYRPARRTSSPRIVGSQTAVVTDDRRSNAVVAIGPEIGCVRVRFHWDRDEERLAREPSSCWVRVSQASAGAGEGALWHPRVGTEVIVDFEDGDPDRPVVVGRVYNGENLPPATTPTASTFKTFSVPGAAVYNELTFEDAAGSETIAIHAGRDMQTYVRADARRHVDGADEVRVTGNRRVLVHGNARHRTDGNRDLKVGGAFTSTSSVRTALGSNGPISLESETECTTDAPRIFQTGESEVTVTVGSSQVKVEPDRIEVVCGESKILIEDGRIKLLG